MTNQSLMVRDDVGLTVTLTEEALALRQDALLSAGEIETVDTQLENEAAYKVHEKLDSLAKLVEKSRKSVKEPVLDCGRAIDAAAKEFISPVSRELTRVATLRGNYQQLQIAKAQAEERARAEELAAIERAKLFELDKARAEELARLEQARALERKQQLELAAAKNLVDHQAIRERYEIEQRKKAELEQAAIAQRKAIEERAAQEAAMIKPVEGPAELDGEVIRQDWQIEVTDIHALYRSRPSCVKLTPLMSEIRSMLDLGAPMAGVKAERVVRSGVRARSERKAIEV